MVADKMVATLASDLKEVLEEVVKQNRDFYYSQVSSRCAGAGKHPAGNQPAGNQPEEILDVLHSYHVLDACLLCPRCMSSMHVTTRAVPDTCMQTAACRSTT